jgi:hypothetical protein
MGRWRSSPRFRRRTWWTVALLSTAGALAAIAVGMPNTPDFPEQHLVDEPAQLVTEPPRAPLTKADAAAVLATTSRFLRTAVAHRHLRGAYDLVGPELRAGMTRAEWAKGAIPVVPFPAARLHAWTLAYAYRNDVALDVGLIAKPGSDTVAKAFRIELRRRSAGTPWKVVSWQPMGISGAGNVHSLRARLRAAPPPPPQPATLGAWWLAFPVALVSLALLLPLAIWLRAWRVGRQAERAYRASRGLA